MHDESEMTIVNASVIMNESDDGEDRSMRSMFFSRHRKYLQGRIYNGRAMKIFTQQMIHLQHPELSVWLSLSLFSKTPYFFEKNH